LVRSSKYEDQARGAATNFQARAQRRSATNDVLRIQLDWRELPLRFLQFRQSGRAAPIGAVANAPASLCAPQSGGTASCEARHAWTRHSTAASPSASAVFAVDGLRVELALRQHWFAGMIRFHVRAIPFVIRNSEELTARLPDYPRAVAEARARRIRRLGRRRATRESRSPRRGIVTHAGTARASP
jgi:hypothetical protein